MPVSGLPKACGHYNTVTTFRREIIFVDTTLWQALGELSLEHQIFFVLGAGNRLWLRVHQRFSRHRQRRHYRHLHRHAAPTPAVLFSGLCNFLGVMLGGTAVAFAIVNLLPVDLLIESSSVHSIVMVISLLLAGMIWNLGTWWYGLPVSSSHTLIGSILGVGLADSLLTRGNADGVNWTKATEVGLSLLISPAVGFIAAAGLLLAMKRVFKNPNLYHPPGEGDNPPHWIRGVLLATCGGVSFAHGSNDGQKGMGLILLALIGFLPRYYSLNVHQEGLAQSLVEAATQIDQIIERESPAVAAAVRPDMQRVASVLAGKSSLAEVSPEDRWAVRQSIFRFKRTLSDSRLTPETHAALAAHRKEFSRSIEYVPYWVIVGVAPAPGRGHHDRLQAHRRNRGRKDRQKPSHVRARGGRRNGRRRHHRPGRHFSYAGQHHACAFVRHRRHHGGQPFRPAGRYCEKDRPGLDPHFADGHLALGQLLCHRRIPDSRGPPHRPANFSHGAARRARLGCPADPARDRSPARCRVNFRASARSVSRNGKR